MMAIMLDEHCVYCMDLTNEVAIFLEANSWDLLRVDQRLHAVYKGRPFVLVWSSINKEWWCQNILTIAMQYFTRISVDNINATITIFLPCHRVLNTVKYSLYLLWHVSNKPANVFQPI